MIPLLFSLLAVGGVETGLDVLVAEDFAPLKGKTVAVLTNHSALDRHGRHLTDHLIGRKDFELKAFLAPEHGFAGKLDREGIAHGTDARTGLTVYSLYGKTKEPTAEMLDGVDVLLFDIQDIGTRFYTYQTTMLYAMRVCARLKVAVMVLDRPNPIGGERVAGPVLDADRFSFTGSFPMPVGHGMTLGETALMFQAEEKLDLDLKVIACKGWRRDQRFDETGLMWINPLPNMRNLKQALLYPAIGLLEFTNLSVGRGTDAPFEHFGAPWLQPVAFCKRLNAADLPGVRFVPHHFTPESGPYKGERCGGVWLSLRDAETWEPVRTSYVIYRTLQQMYPDDYRGERYLRLLGNARSFEQLNKDVPIDNILAREAKERTRFMKIRGKHLLYE